MAAGKTIPLYPAASGRAAELLAQGWIKQTTIDEPRLSEIAENYRSLGYAVEIVAHHAAAAGGCNTCFEEGEKIGKFSSDVFVRKLSAGNSPADELF